MPLLSLTPKYRPFTRPGGDRLRNLPFEIRLIIWAYLIPYKNRIRPLQVRSSYIHEMETLSDQGTLSHPATYTFKSLSLTCRDIHDEECNLLYQDNEFVFLTPVAMLNYLAAIMPERRERIHCISVTSLSHLVSYDIFIILSVCRHLRHLSIRTHRYSAEVLSETLRSFLYRLRYFDMKLLRPREKTEIENMSEQEKSIITTTTEAVTSKCDHLLLVPTKAIDTVTLTASVDIRGEERVFMSDKASSYTRRRSNMCSSMGAFRRAET